ncbi:MAG: 3-oxoacyl-acyl-carrier protein reductase [bacterium]|nr:MAG: 3-oxoacyl-acyl-carrier protein reductase [bacterium]
MGKLNGKVAIITGSGRGLGRGFALAMSKEGAFIVVNDVDDSANEVVKEIKSSGGKAVAVVGGVGTKEVAEKLVSTAVKEFGRLDILVNNAGIIRDSLLHKMEEKQWDDVITVHLKGTFLNTQAAVKYMIENNIKGRIVNITSSAGLYGNVGQANYSAAKAGIVGLTLSNAKELARRGICVNAVAPAAQTTMTESMPDKVKEMLYKQLASTSTIQRMGQPEDVAPTVIFLASDDSYFVTGQVICAMGATGVI